ncbi:TrmB family transcriptional regulator [Halorubellus sp. PRR65]|uniref:TrmB family transcriptional regulator n=1 Tax=Halorubellus sp. PRR65 TaxID=3098148 RepID=UPI002B2581CC|nr:TrmB family transcriptional regulator [Halorubellus sp. PRR65]
MSIQQSAAIAKPETLPETIASPRAKLVYLYLDVTEAATVEDLQECLDMKKIDLLSVLNSLTSAGHVASDDGTYAVTA